MEQTVMPTKQCKCDLHVTCPERITFDFDEPFTHVCKTCEGGITYQQNDNYNRYWGFSGYDEVHDDD